MNILAVCGHYPRLGHPNAGIFVQKQLRELRNRGHHVQVVVPLPYVPPLPGFARRWGDYQQAAGLSLNDGGIDVRYLAVPMLPRRLGFYWYPGLHYFALRRQLSSVVNWSDVDVIHAHPAFPEGAVSVRLGRDYGVPVVLTVHGQDVNVTARRSKLIARAVGRVLSDADATIFVSERLRRSAEALGLLKTVRRSCVIGNGVFLDESPLPGEVEFLRETAGNRVIVLTVGNLVASKRHCDVLRAIASSSVKDRLAYWIVGDGPLRASLEEEAQRLGIGPQVTFTGEVPHTEVPRFMAACDIFALPSSPEGFGVVYLEAFREGVPVVACYDQGESDLLRAEETALLVSPGDVAAIRSAIERLTLDPALKTRLGATGRRLVESRYTWDKQMDKLVDLYLEVCSQKRVGKP